MVTCLLFVFFLLFIFCFFFFFIFFLFEAFTCLEHLEMAHLAFFGLCKSSLSSSVSSFFSFAPSAKLHSLLSSFFEIQFFFSKHFCFLSFLILLVFSQLRFTDCIRFFLRLKKNVIVRFGLLLTCILIVCSNFKCTCHFSNKRLRVGKGKFSIDGIGNLSLSTVA